MRRMSVPVRQLVSSSCEPGEGWRDVVVAAEVVHHARHAEHGRVEDNNGNLVGQGG